MSPLYLKPKQALNKAFLKVKPNRADIEFFKSNLVKLIDQTNDAESEEFHKNLAIDFFKRTYYDPHHYINTKGRNDLVIHNGDKAKSTVGVIIEVKKPTNKAEMVSVSDINGKAFQELVLYYLRERITHKNLEVKHLIVTNVLEWFIFDAQVFERFFAQNKALVKQFEEFEAGRLVDSKTEFFYKHIAEPEVERVKAQIPFTYFTVRTYERPLRNRDKKDDGQLISLFKIFSPEHLLKLPFVNDSNRLDKRFYSELLHIIGLAETKEGGKKLIKRNEVNARNRGSILEDAIIQLESLDKISQLGKPGQYGGTTEERLFNVGLELGITWINRVLFLKLLEAQLLIYHKGDKSQAFLNKKNIHDWDEMNLLFFQVLAKKKEERNEGVRQTYARVPYLNSSLFEPTALEQKTIMINFLKNDSTLPVHSSTVLKNDRGKKTTGSLPTLDYLLKFLDAYDFASEGSEEIQEENKTLINASVLGLIFEKINGYKDGSFFTPGFITMYMCRETIRRSVLQKFNEVKGWKLREFTDLKEDLAYEIKNHSAGRREARKQANDIINSLKICDPAVGSGHFLVSALNEIIAIKSELQVLVDKEGDLLTNYDVEVVNDELIVTHVEGGLFEYHPANRESQRIQETLFQEKQTIIESCLFGVDINPNSVKICRLRLWIELLKNAYYKEETLPGFGNLKGLASRQLETLPNIDINIKWGNSLVSRFALKEDLSQALKKSKFTIETYRIAVSRYRSANSKEEKREMERLILEIKQSFSFTITMNNPLKKKLDKLASELYHRFTGTFLFEPQEDYGGRNIEDKRKKEQKNLETEIEKLSKKIDEIKESSIYQGSFEWRFEFPEVLDDEGNYIGFDVVIGNPPYIRIQDLQKSDSETVEYLNKSYQSTGKGNYDIYIPFIELGYDLLKKNATLCYIMPHKFLNANYGSAIRGFLRQKSFPNKIIHFGAAQVFEDATTYTGIFLMTKKKNDFIEFAQWNDPSKIMDIEENNFSKTKSDTLSVESWSFLNPTDTKLLEKLQGSSNTLESVTERIFQGLKTSADKIFIVRKIAESEHSFIVYSDMNGREFELEKTLLYPLIKGGNSRPYQILEPELLILFPYLQGRLISSNELSSRYPKTYQYLLLNKEYLENRESGKMKNDKWFGYVYPKALLLIDKPKIFTPDIAPSPRFSFDESGSYMFTGGASGGYGIIPKGLSHLFLLGILNSAVAEWYIRKTSTQMRGGWFSFESRYIRNIPMPAILESKELEMLTDMAIKDPANLALIKPQIDQLVYKLYELSEEEVKVIKE